MVFNLFRESTEIIQDHPICTWYFFKQNKMIKNQLFSKNYSNQHFQCSVYMSLIGTPLKKKNWERFQLFNHEISSVLLAKQLRHFFPSIQENCWIILYQSHSLFLKRIVAHQTSYVFSKKRKRSPKCPPKYPPFSSRKENIQTEEHYTQMKNEVR